MFAARSLVRLQRASLPIPIAQVIPASGACPATTLSRWNRLGHVFLSSLPWTPQKLALLSSTHVGRAVSYSSAATEGVDAVAAVRSGETVGEEVEEIFPTEDDHLAFLAGHARLPEGFLVGTRTFSFNPRELPSLDAQMTLSMLALENPNGTESWSAMFTKMPFLDRQSSSAGTYWQQDMARATIYPVRPV